MKKKNEKSIRRSLREHQIFLSLEKETFTKERALKLVITMNRTEAILLLKEKITEPVLIKHSLAVGAIMKGLATELKEDPELWEATGILHDIDFQTTKDDHKQHGILAQEILKDKLPPESLYAIKAHNHEHTETNPIEKLDFALISSDAVSGLIIAAALVRPDKQLSEVKVKSITKKFKQKDFARACSRESMMLYEKLGLERGKFFEIALESLKQIHEELDL
jgi:uncharacterized protein